MLGTKNFNRRYRDKAKIYTFTLVFFLLLVDIIFLVNVYTKNHDALREQDDNVERQLKNEVKKILDEVRVAVELIAVNDNADLACHDLKPQLFDAAIQNTYAAMFYVINADGSICSPHKISVQLHRFLSNDDILKLNDGIHKIVVSEDDDNRFFMLLSKHIGSKVYVGVINYIYVIDDIEDYNRAGDGVKYSLKVLGDDISHSSNYVDAQNNKGEIGDYNLAINYNLTHDMNYLFLLDNKLSISLLVFFNFCVICFLYKLAPIVKEYFLYIDIVAGCKYNEFTPYLQPIVDSGNNNVVGCEVLVRWNHPLYGLISPLEFIHVAEQKGLIIRLTENLMAQVATSLSNEKELREFSVSFNVTLEHLLSPTLISACQHFYSEFIGESSPKICLEIIERSSFDDYNDADILVAMKSLNGIGVTFAVDDYGTGYSSLKHIYSECISVIKIDHHFVRHIVHSTIASKIVMNILDLASRINAVVVAEGVEQDEQAEFLKLLGVHRFQGFLYGKPIPLNEFKMRK